MTQRFQRFTIGVLIGLTVVSSILLYSGCGKTRGPNIPANPTPTPTPTPDTPPTSTITSPTEGAIVPIGIQVAITGTASDPGGGTVDKVEVSVDGGATYSAATGTNAWSFNWTPSSPGPATIKSRAVDYTGNVQNPPAEIHVTVDAPQVVSTKPINGATGVSTGIAPRATFSKPLDPASVDSTTVLMKDMLNNPVPVTVSCATSAFTIALVPKALLQPGQIYTVTLKGGLAEPHITDSTGLPLASDYTWSFSTAAAPPPVTGVSIWDDSVIPPTPIFPDSTPVEVGLKFRSDKDGLVTGVRFYKGGAANGGTHVGHLWTSTGTLLSTVTFTGESDTGWQQAFFATPVLIRANTFYVVSYFAPQGNYAADGGFFASSGVDNGPLHAPSDPFIGGNGVFNDNPSGGFPSQSFNATNYWVDVVFVDTEPLPPQVISTTPAPGVIDVSTIIAPVAVFSKSLVSMTGNSSTVRVTDTADDPVPFTVVYNPVNFSVSLLPKQELQPGQAYTVTLKAGPTPPFIIDSTGIPLPSDYTWSFTTATPPPPGAAISIWDDSVIPSNPIFPDSTPVEVGLKFRSNKDGLVTGVRFYKGGAANGGTHVGHLWTSTGTLLSTVTFTGESDTGWQQAFNATNYWVDVVFVDTEPLPPQVISTTPAPGVIDVSTIIAPVAVFSKSLVSMTLNSSTVLVTDTADNPVPFTVLYKPVNFSVTLLPQQELQPGQAYTVTLKAGPTPPFIIDSTGIPLPSDYTWSFTTATPPPPGAAISIWDDSVIPSNPIFPDSTPVEVGLKFRSNKDGLVTGVRFYKGGAANGGTHVGHLWTIAGTLLGTVTFTGESDAGWQQALFQTPIPITANTIYVVSYFAPQGHYAADSGFFASFGVDTPPLHAFSNTVAGGNGVFNDNPSGGFPSQSFNATNYWVDVVFVDPEPLPPQVISTTPAAGAIDVSTNIAPVAAFSKSLDPTSVNDTTVLLTDATITPVSVNVTYDSTTLTITLTPQQALTPEQTYTVTLKGGPASPHITDSTGIPLASDYTWSFTTETQGGFSIQRRRAGFR